MFFTPTLLKESENINRKELFPILEADDDEDNFDMDDNEPEDDDDSPQEPTNTPGGINAGEDDNFDMENEPEDDPEPIPANEPESQSTEGEDNFDMDDNEPEAEGETGGEGIEGGGTDPGTEDEFDMPGDGEEEGAEDGEDPNSSADTGSNGGSDDEITTRIKELEKNIYETLPENEKQNNTNELRRLYTLLHEKCDDVIEKVHKIEKDVRVIKAYDFIITRLNEMKQYIMDYLSNNFDNRTFLQNMVTFQKYLSVLDTINSILKELSKGE